MSSFQLSTVTLRGCVLPASKRGPAIIMSAGFNMPKDAILPDIGKWFQEHGISCLLFDSQGIGSSDGEPRNDVDARQQAEHLHDAVTWFLEQPYVDDTKIALWGLCFGGNVSLAAAAFERRNFSKRVSAVIAVAPLIDSTGNPERRQPILELAMHDRVSRLAGEEPMYLPYVNEDGSVPNGLQMPADMMPALDRLGIPVENRISFDMSCPTKEQLQCFELMDEPKELDILKGKGHLDWVFGDVESILERQLDFLKRRLVF
ncbi:alpha/beta-hydrolase [Mollisia scopiformis]|uniref:Alpha/beta-hydrolase n=1 Tax=Mollisia scopiformis TaxID=149040 RepID=A0A132BBY6_MOLSC|nr:alpha/beta-hydrolase [Mollisia scopiformis]KUJ09891.1 alpha/beta-hydrolase [Mollisia scopiformis]